MAVRAAPGGVNGRWQRQAAAVRIRAGNNELWRFRCRSDVVGAPGDAFGEQGERPFNGKERRRPAGLGGFLGTGRWVQGRTTSTMPTTASCTLASSETACTMAMSAARRGAMPCVTSCAA